ncbi:hypothetical protein SHKM778_07700 [Streptomyces sp. KM77-8]|uniref:Uncharacterized protein n=1 Tax=Streptomyces haneummycinicus TaxID=3074435 RepID=A0AAT9HAE4_9ACTN
MGPGDEQHRPRIGGAGPGTSAVMAAVDRGERGDARAAVQTDPGEAPRRRSRGAGSGGAASGNATGPRIQISGPCRMLSLLLTLSVSMPLWTGNRTDGRWDEPVTTR